MITIELFHNAAKCNDLSKIQEYIQENLDSIPNLNIPDDDGCTAMLLAALHGHIDIVNILVASGADINITDNNNNTAMQVLFDLAKNLYHKINQNQVSIADVINCFDAIDKRSEDLYATARNYMAILESKEEQNSLDMNDDDDALNNPNNAALKHALTSMETSKSINNATLPESQKIVNEAFSDILGSKNSRMDMAEAYAMIAYLSKQFNHLENQNTELNNRAYDLEKENAALHERVDALRRAKNTANTPINTEEDKTESYSHKFF